MPFPLCSGRFADPLTNCTRRFPLYPGDPHLILESWQRWYLNWTICWRGQYLNTILNDGMFPKPST